MKWEIDTHTAYKAALSDDNKLIKKNWGYEIKDVRETNVEHMYIKLVLKS